MPLHLWIFQNDRTAILSHIFGGNFESYVIDEDLDEDVPIPILSIELKVPSSNWMVKMAALAKKGLAFDGNIIDPQYFTDGASDIVPSLFAGINKEFAVTIGWADNPMVEVFLNGRAKESHMTMALMYHVLHVKTMKAFGYEVDFDEGDEDIEVEPD